MLEILRREAIYLWYYFDIQLRQIFWYWVLGILLGSAISVFAKNWIHAAAEFLGRRVPGIIGLVFASALGIASPLCMYGTIPICAAFSKKGIKDDFLAAFMMSSILLNPQLIIYSTALGTKILAVRIVSCFLCGVLAGVMVRLYCNKNKNMSEVQENVKTKNYSPFTTRKSRERRVNNFLAEPTAKQLINYSLRSNFFDFHSFNEPHNNDVAANIFLRYIKNVGRNIKATGFWFLVGIALSAVFQRYVPEDLMGKIFGAENIFGINMAWGVLMAATIGVPLYVCGGGTIPLLLDWLAEGMSIGSAAAFMITGPATKITNLGALKIALGAKHFAAYILFVILFSLATGVLVNLFL